MECIVHIFYNKLTVNAEGLSGGCMNTEGPTVCVYCEGPSACVGNSLVCGIAEVSVASPTSFFCIDIHI